MSEPSVRILFEAIRAVFKNENISANMEQLTIDAHLDEALKLANKHDITHLLIQGLTKNTVNDSLINNTKHIPLLAVFRYEKSNYELRRICEVFEKHKIEFLPLKGSVLRNYYPEPWMRTSCDIDILIKEHDLSRAVECLTDELEYEVHGKFTHDVSLFSKSNVHVELHFDLIESVVSENSAAILKNVWDTSYPKDNHCYSFEMSDEMLYFYHVAHMAKHFENGGCGIRPFLDLWILDNIDGVDHLKRNEMLSKGDLLQFANAARKLSKAWFENAEMDPVSQQMEDYILRGGVYGNDENRILVQQQKKGGRIRYALSKIFIPYDELKFHYPILQKYRWLTPIMEVRRWCKLFFCGHLKRTARELTYNSNVSDVAAANTRKLLYDIGLKNRK